MKHHMRMERVDQSDGENITRPHWTDDDEDEPARATPDGKPANEETQWRCVECGQEDTYLGLEGLECPNGLEPYYAQDEPGEITLAERDVGTHIERYRILRCEVYKRDERYERAKALKDSPRAEVMRRLGAIGGHWHSFSKIDDGHMGDLCLRLMREHGVAPQTSPHGSGNQCCIGFSEREQKWYGWSHRAVYGFDIGYVAGEGHVCTQSGVTDEYLEEHPEADVTVPVGFECKTLDDCKRCAIAFAESVG